MEVKVKTSLFPLEVGVQCFDCLNTFLGIDRQFSFCYLLAIVITVTDQISQSFFKCFQCTVESKEGKKNRDMKHLLGGQHMTIQVH